MKRFLILPVLAAFLAISAISMADVVTGAGVVPTLTIQANGIQYPNGGLSPSVKTTQSFPFTKGAFFFNVSSVNPSSFSSGGGDATKNQRFQAQVTFAGGASSTAAGKTTTISNVFMNLSGMVMSAQMTKSAAIGSGTVNGTFNLTDGSADPVKNMSFTGSYRMNVSLAGFVTDINGSTNPTSGIASFTMLIAGVNGPVFDDAGIQTGTTPEPMVVNVTLGAIPFKIVTALGTGYGTHNVTGMWAATYTNTSTGEVDAETLNLTQNGNSVTGSISDPTHGSIPLSGFISGSGITMQFSDPNKGETVTSKGTLNADGTMSGTYGSTFGAIGKWSATKNIP